MHRSNRWIFVLTCAALFAPPVWAQSDEVAATIDGKPVTLKEVDAKVMKSNMKLAQQIYDARKAAVDELVVDHLLAAEAAEKKTTPAELFKQRVAERATPVTDADVEAFFNANQNRMGGKPLEQVSGQIRPYLATQRETEARAALMGEMKAKSDIKMSLDPPRIEVAVASNDPSFGPADAKVTIVEFSEFQCPFCGRVGPTLKQIKETYGDKVRVVFRDFPMAMHNRAQASAEAAQCANEQGKFWEYHDALFANMQGRSDDDLKKFAADLGLNTEAFNECFTAGKFRADVLKDFADGQSYGVTGTPAFFVNGRFLSGAQPFESFKAIIDDELSRG